MLTKGTTLSVAAVLLAVAVATTRATYHAGKTVQRAHRVMLNDEPNCPYPRYWFLTEDGCEADRDITWKGDDYRSISGRVSGDTIVVYVWTQDHCRGSGVHLVTLSEEVCVGITDMRMDREDIVSSSWDGYHRYVDAGDHNHDAYWYGGTSLAVVVGAGSAGLYYQKQKKKQQQAGEAAAAAASKTGGSRGSRRSKRSTASRRSKRSAGSRGSRKAVEV